MNLKKKIVISLISFWGVGIILALVFVSILVLQRNLTISRVQAGPGPACQVPDDLEVTGYLNVNDVYKKSGVAGVSSTCPAGQTFSGLIVSGGILTSTGVCTAIGGGGAPIDASYVVAASNATLTAERILTNGAGISVTDLAGNPGTITVANTSGVIANKGLQVNASKNFGLIECATDNYILKYNLGTQTWACAADSTGGLVGGAIDKVAFWTSASSLSYNNNFHFDNTNTRLSIGIASPDASYKITTSGGGIKAENSSANPAGYFSSTGGGYAIQTGTGDINIAGTAVYRRGGTAGVSTAVACGAAQYLSGLQVSGGIVTAAGSCVAPAGGVANAFARIANSGGVDQFSATGESSLRAVASGGLAITYDAVNKGINYSIADSGVTTIKIADLNVTNAKISEMDWVKLQSYPASATCPVGQFVTQIADAITCAAPPAGGITWPLLAPDGTAAAPSYSFTNNSNLGIFRAGANILAFTTAGSERMRIDGSGNIGIPSIDASYKITTSSGGIKAENSSANPAGYFSSGGGGYAIQTGSGQILFGSLTNCPNLKTNASGLLQCNTTTYLTSESDPQVNTLTASKWCTSDGTVINCTSDAPAGGVSSVSNSDGTLTISPTTGAVVASLNLAHANTWTGTQTFSANTNFPGSGIWNTSGNVGVGTSSPTSSLHVITTPSSTTSTGIKSELSRSSGYTYGINVTASNAGSAGTDRNYGISSSANGGWLAYGLYGQANGNSGGGVGVSGYANGAGTNWGVQGQASGTGINNYGTQGLANGAGTNYGLYGQANSGSTNYGVYGIVNSAGTNYGLYGKASGGSTNYGLYVADGDAYINGNLQLKNSGRLDLGSGWTCSGGEIDDWSITFPKSFPNIPVVILTMETLSDGAFSLSTRDVTTTGFKIHLYCQSLFALKTIYWIAFAPF